MVNKSEKTNPIQGYLIFWVILAFIYNGIQKIFLEPVISSFCLGALVPLICLSVLVYFQKKRINQANFLARNSFNQDYSPAEFEHVTTELFRRYGYQAEVTPQSGDQGIDIVLKKEEKTIGVQCKRYKIENKIGPGVIREFVGALEGRGIAIGYFVTTSDFTKAARETAQKSRYRIKLISGSKLGEMRTHLDDRIITGLIPKTWWFQLEKWQKAILIFLFFLSLMAVISGIAYISMA